MSAIPRTALSLSELVARVAEEIEEVHRVQNAERIEAFCRELASRYHRLLSELEVVLAKQDVLRFLAPDEAEGLEMVVQQGLALVQETSERALVERQGGLSTAAGNYLNLLATQMARIDGDLEAQRARLRARLGVLRTLFAHLPGGETFLAQIEDLARRIADLRLAPFDAESWKRSAVGAYRLAETAAEELEGRFSPQTVEALAELTTGQSVPLTRLGVQSLRELLDLPAVAGQLVIRMEARQEH